jgi:hypothetical protein
MALHKEGKACIGAGPDRLPSRRQTRSCALNNPSGRNRSAVAADQIQTGPTCHLGFLEPKRSRRNTDRLCLSLRSKVQEYPRSPVFN